MPEVAYKTCRLCDRRKPLSAFNRRKHEDDGIDKRCRDCVNERSRESKRLYLERHPERRKATLQRYGSRNPEKLKAREILNRAVRLGHLDRPVCCDSCGAKKPEPRGIEAHHHDYSKPLDVRWLCQACHWKEHRESDASLRISKSPV